MAIVAKFINTKISQAESIEDALNYLISSKAKYKNLIKDESLISSETERVTNRRNTEMVKCINYKIVEIQAFKRLKLNITSPATMVKAIELRNEIMNKGCGKLRC